LKKSDGVEKDCFATFLLFFGGGLLINQPFFPRTPKNKKNQARGWVLSKRAYRLILEENPHILMPFSSFLGNHSSIKNNDLIYWFGISGTKGVNNVLMRIRERAKRKNNRKEP